MGYKVLKYLEKVWHHLEILGSLNTGKGDLGKLASCQGTCDAEKRQKAEAYRSHTCKENYTNGCSHHLQ